MTTLSTSVKSTNRQRENLAGSAATGSNGDANRIFTLTTSSSVTIREVYLDGLLLIENTDYTVNNTTRKITVLVNVFNNQNLSVIYEV